MNLNSKNKAKIYHAVPADLEGVSMHRNVAFIRRLVLHNFPVHLAVHDVTLASGDKNTEIYSSPHSHADMDEVNILISKSSLVYEILLGDTIHEVAAPATIWIPAGVSHSANVIDGEGFSVCLRFNTKKLCLCSWVNCV